MSDFGEPWAFHEPGRHPTPLKGTQRGCQRHPIPSVEEHDPTLMGLLLVTVSRQSPISHSAEAQPLLTRGLLIVSLGLFTSPTVREGGGSFDGACFCSAMLASFGASQVTSKNRQSKFRRFEVMLGELIIEERGKTTRTQGTTG